MKWIVLLNKQVKRKIVNWELSLLSNSCFASHLSSQSYSFQNPDVFAESSSEDVRQKTISRVQERYSSPSTLNVKRFTEFALLESSLHNCIT